MTTRPSGGDDGVTLVETLIALVILSIAAVALVAAMSGLVLASTAHRGIATTDNVLRSYGEAVASKAQTVSLTTWDQCPTAAEVLPTFGVPGATLSGTTLAYWVPKFDAASHTTDWSQGTFVNQATCQATFSPGSNKSACNDSSPTPDEPECFASAVRVTYAFSVSAASLNSHSTAIGSSEVTVRRGNP